MDEEGAFDVHGLDGTEFESILVERTAMKPADPKARPLSPPSPATDQGIRVPIWFTVAQALKVADLKNVDHIVVQESGQSHRIVSREVLRRAPATDLLGRWASTRPAPDSDELSLSEESAAAADA